MGSRRKHSSPCCPHESRTIGTEALHGLGGSLPGICTFRRVKWGGDSDRSWCSCKPGHNLTKDYLCDAKWQMRNYVTRNAPCHVFDAFCHSVGQTCSESSSRASRGDLRSAIRPETWKRFVGSLARNGFFEGELEGSKRYREKTSMAEVRYIRYVLAVVMCAVGTVDCASTNITGIVPSRYTSRETEALR